LDDLCSRLAADRINLGLLVHIADFRIGESSTAASIRSLDAFAGYVYGSIRPNECNIEKTVADVCRVSIFPHDQRPDVTASLIRVLADSGVKPYVLGSSTSAMTVVVSSSDFQVTMQRLFDAFTFHPYESYDDWRAAYRGEEALRKDVRLSYHEEVISIFGIAHRTNFDQWNVTLPLERLKNFEMALSSLNQFQLGMPFLVSISPPGEDDIYFSFLLEAAHHIKVARTFAEALPDVRFSCLAPVALLFFHGPHFGDRYGIANALVKVLRKARITLLALSCAVASISLVVRACDLDQTIEALGSVFQTPAAQPRNRS
jgi:aspartokinase